MNWSSTFLIGLVALCSCNSSKINSENDPCSGMYLPRKNNEIVNDQARKYFNQATNNHNISWEERIKLCNKADSIEPNNPKILHERGLYKNNMGNFDEAIVDLNRSIEFTKDPQRKMIRIENRGLVYHEHGDIDKACEDFKSVECGNSPSYVTKYCK